jgi:hypothetical protein
MCSVPFFQLVIAGGTAGDDQGGGSVLQTLLNLILRLESWDQSPGKYRQLEADGGFYQTIHPQSRSWERRPVEEGDTCCR